MGFFDKIKEGLSKTRQSLSSGLDSVIANFRHVDEDVLEELEEALIMADIGAETALSAVEQLRQNAKMKAIDTPDALKRELRDILGGMMTKNEGIDLETKPSVVLFVGVNGVGKTTTAGKLAQKLREEEGKKVLLAAADTFRAAAAEQLAIWAERAKADIVRHEEGADPAAVVFDAASAAKARGADVLICDTAGRLHNKQNLMNELSKIDRVIERELPGASRETILVLDATTGQNALSQARQFNEAAKLTGIALTKLDGTAKGGVVIAVSTELNIPVKFIGVGEKVEDLMPFDADKFLEALLDIEE